MPDTNPQTPSPDDLLTQQPGAQTESTVIDGTVDQGNEATPASDDGDAAGAIETPSQDSVDVDQGTSQATETQEEQPLEGGEAESVEAKPEESADAQEEDGAPSTSSDAAEGESEPESDSEPVEDNSDAPVIESDAGDAPDVQGPPAIPQASAFRPDSDAGDGTKIATDPNAGPGPIDPSVSGGELTNTPANVPNVPVTEDVAGVGKDTNPQISDGTPEGDSAETVTEDSGTPDASGDEEGSDEEAQEDEGSEDETQDESEEGDDSEGKEESESESMFGEPKQLVANIVELLEDAAMEAYKESGDKSVKALRLLGAVPTDMLDAADKELLNTMQSALQEHVKHVLAFFHMAD